MIKKRFNKLCLQCKKEFTTLHCYKKVFCSHKCRGEYRIKINLNICKQCKKEFIAKRHTLKQKYCSKECYWDKSDYNDTCVGITSLCSSGISIGK